MKTLVVYSSVTGNTRKIAEAIAEVMPSCELIAVEDAPTCVEGYDLVAVGYWNAKGLPDAKTREWLKEVRNSELAFFATSGALPDSEHARECMAKAESLAAEPKRGNTVHGSWMCQGRIDPHVIEVMKRLDLAVHRDLLRDPARMEAAASHPDERDCRAAQAYFAKLLDGLHGASVNASHHHD